jgi:hypothetical protein
VRIFQLKYFREGFSSERRGRRKQVTQSFMTAVQQHSPSEWVLVIPTNPTPGEEDFVYGLAADAPELKVRIVGRKELDSRLGRFPDLIDYFTRDQLREAARIFNQEKAMLYGGLPDLADRVRDLTRVADSLDPDWKIESTARDGVVTHLLLAKHRRAAEKSPITLSVTGAFGPEHTSLAAVFRRSLGFGTSEAVTLPPETVRDLTFTGPSWLPAPEGRVEVTWVPEAHLPETCSVAQIHLTGIDGRMLSSYQGSVRHAGSGFLGYSVELDFNGTASLTLLMGRDDEAQLNGTFDFTEAKPTVVLETVCLFRDLQNTHELDLELDGVQVGRFTCSKPVTMDDPTAKALAITEMLASDLEVVQRHSRTFFPVPAELSVDDRVAIRFARLLIEGNCVAHPSARSYTATLNGLDSAELRKMLSVEAPVAIRVDADMTLEVAGWKLPLGQVSVFHTQVEIRDRAEVLSAVKHGRAAGRTMKLVPIEGQSYRAFLRSARAGRDYEPLHVTGWGLPGLDGPPAG